MTELKRVRHSRARVMATAILRLRPDAQFSRDPSGESGLLLPP